MSSSGGIAGASIELSVDRAGTTAELEQLRSTVRATFSSMSDDALRFAAAQDRYDRAIRKSNGEITASVTSAELNIRRVRAEAVKSSAAVTRSATETTAAIHREEQAFGRLGRGAIVGSGALRGLGRSAIYASSTFLGSAGLVFGIKDSIEQAETGAKAHAALATALEKIGVDAKAQLPTIDAWAAKQAEFGVSSNTAVTGLARLVQLTGSTEKAMQAYNAALDISKATGKDFNAVSLAVGKAMNGQTTALARYIGQIPKGTSTQQLLNLVMAKYGGQAQANTLATDRLHAEVTNLETSIGNALLPTVDKLAGGLADWLGKSRNQAAIQRDVNEAVRVGGAVVHALGDAYGAIAPPVKTLSHLLGGTEHTVEALGAAFALQKLGVLPALYRAVAGGIAATGDAAVVATGELDALTAAEGRAAAGGGVGGAVGRGAAGAGAGGFLARASRVVPFTPFITAAIADYGLSKSTKSHPGPQLLGHATSIEGKGVFSVKTSAHRSIQYDNGTWYDTETGEKITLAEAAKALGVSASRLQAEVTPKHDASDTRLRRGQGSPTGPVLNGPGITAGKPRPLDRLTRINLAVSAATAGIARGDKGAQAQLVKALKDEIDYDRQYEKIQQGLVAKGGKDAAAHAATLQRLYGDEQSALDQITSIEDAAAAKKAATAKTRATNAAKRAAAKKKADQDLIRAIAGYGQSSQTLEGQLAAGHHATAAERLAVQRQMTAAEKKTGTSDPRAEQQQFLSDVQRIISAYAPNAFPSSIEVKHMGMVATHLYSMKHELRQQTHEIRKQTQQRRFPASDYAIASATAALGS